MPSTLHHWQLVEQVGLLRLRAHRREADGAGRPRLGQRVAHGRDHCTGLGKTGRRIEDRRDQHEHAIRSSETTSQSGGIAHLGNRQLAAALYPRCGLARIARNRPHIRPVGQERAGDGAAHLTGNPRDRVHG
jgi:hypothetical protein